MDDYTETLLVHMPGRAGPYPVGTAGY